MALNEIYKDADSLVYKVPADVKSGDAVFPLVANGGTEFVEGLKYLVGIAETDAKLGEDGNYYTTLRHSGVFSFTGSGGGIGGAVFLQGTDLAQGYGTDVTTAPPSSVDKVLEVGKVIRDDGTQLYVRINN